MIFSTRFILAAVVLGVVAAQDTGKPVSEGRTANRTEPAVNVFGTTTQSINWTSAPKTLCVVPMYQNEAGISEEKKQLITQQALDLCPQAQRISVHSS